MKPTAVADVGNSRMKWGLCANGGIRDIESLPSEDVSAWEHCLLSWHLPSKSDWIVTGVHPSRRDRLADWLRERGQQVMVLDDPKYLPLRVLLPRPEHAGIDRLLNAVAANSRRSPGFTAVIVDAGSAVTVDLVDSEGSFVGGAILPGLRLMAKALHDYTALLPLVDPPSRQPILPGIATRPAVEAGIFWAVAGGVEAVVREYGKKYGSKVELFFTGGDGPVLHPVFPKACLWPEMTLEGIRLSAETLP
jgi:type III pantothenate kinase